MNFLKQKNIPYIGAVYELLSRVSFLYSLVSQILMTRLYFYNSDDSLLKEFFGSYWLFIGFLILICWLLSWVAWAFVIPSQNKFCQEQAVIEGRSPTYELLLEIQQEIRELKK